MKHMIAALLLLASCAAPSFADGPATALRYPVALARLDERTVATANERSGTVSLVDLTRRSVVSELPVGKRLSAMTATGAGQLLITDSVAQEVILLRRSAAGALEVCDRLEVDGDPSAIAASAEGRTVYIVARWARTLDVLSISADNQLAKSARVALPFPPGRILLLPDGQHLLIAEAFGGQLAVMDIDKRALVTVRNIGGHNIADLVWDAQQNRLLVAHQILASSLPVTLDNIQWGAVLKNVVRVITREQLLSTDTNLATATRVIALGQEGDGSADPTAILPLDDGGFAVSLGGADEVVVVESTGLLVKRIRVGRRPLALLPGANPRQVAVMNHFDSSLSLVDLDSGSAFASVSLGPTPKLTPAQRGEHLFYDARLSFEKWMSCHSCHTDGHTNGLRADTLGDNSFGAPKRTLTLLGTRDTDRWAWNGEVKELHDQVRKSIETSMHGEASADDVYGLTAYLHTLAPPPALLPKARDAADRAQLERGRRVFKTQKCNDCHIGPLTYTSHDVYDVSLSDENKQTKFNPPSLRGVGQASSLFHDGRATALEDVVDVFGHQVREPLSDDDRAALLRFLKSL